MLEWLENQEFYELMQAYRHAPIMPQQPVVNAFQDIKDFIRKRVEEADV